MIVRRYSLKGLMVLLLGCCLFLSGCNLLDFSVKFNSVDGLKQDDPVLFEDQAIGRIKEVVYTQNADFLVSIEIAEEYSHAATTNTRFYIVDSPLGSPGGKAVELEQENPAGEKIASGAVVEGSTQTPELSKSADQAFDSLQQSMEGLLLGILKEMDKFQESDQYRDIKKKLGELEKDLRSSGEKLGKILKDEVLPQLEQTLKDAIKTLERQGRKDEAKELEQEYNRLQSI